MHLRIRNIICTICWVLRIIFRCRNSHLVKLNVFSLSMCLFYPSVDTTVFTPIPSWHFILSLSTYCLVVLWWPFHLGANHIKWCHYYIKSNNIREHRYFEITGPQHSTGVDIFITVIQLHHFLFLTFQYFSIFFVC